MATVLDFSLQRAVGATRDRFRSPFSTYTEPGRLNPLLAPIGSGAQCVDITEPKWFDPAWQYSDLRFADDKRSIAAQFRVNASDPLRTVHVTRLTMMQQDANNPNYNKDTIWGARDIQVRIPDNIPAAWADPRNNDGTAAQLFDHALFLLDPDNLTISYLWLARRLSDMTWRCSDFVRDRVDQSGYGKSPFGDRTFDGDPRYWRPSGGASGLHIMHESWQPGELLNGRKRPGRLRINVALCNKALNGGRGYFWPGSWTDQPNTNYAGTGNITIGCLVALPNSINIETARTWRTPQGKNIAYMAQRHGIYITDTSHRPLFYPDYSVLAAGEIPDQDTSGVVSDMKWMWNNLKLVVNNGPTTPGGGGTPLQPVAPPLA